MSGELAGLRRQAELAFAEVQIGDPPPLPAPVAPLPRLIGIELPSGIRVSPLKSPTSSLSCACRWGDQRRRESAELERQNEKMRRTVVGQRSERTGHLLDQMELAFEECEAASSEDGFLAAWQRRRPTSHPSSASGPPARSG